MTITQTLLQHINAEINSLPRGDYGEVLLDHEQFSDLPESTIFLEPAPDVVLEEPHLQIQHEYADHPSLLGLYVPMRSPGRIILIERNLRRFFWSLIVQVKPGLPYLFPNDLEGAFQLVIEKTYQHERFHFHCDVMRQLLGGHYDPYHEEALAVAWSRLWILEQAWNSKIKRMNQALYLWLMKAAYDYRSPGYRDWPQFADRVQFEPALLDYLAAPGAFAQLQSNGVSNLSEVLARMTGEVRGGCIEEVVG